LGGADVEVEVLAAHSQVEAMAGADATLLPGDLGDLQVRDLAMSDPGPHEVIELAGRGREAFDQSMPVAENLGRLARHMFPSDGP